MVEFIIQIGSKTRLTRCGERGRRRRATHASPRVQWLACGRQHGVAREYRHFKINWLPFLVRHSGRSRGTVSSSLEMRGESKSREMTSTNAGGAGDVDVPSEATLSNGLMSAPLIPKLINAGCPFAVRPSAAEQIRRNILNAELVRTDRSVGRLHNCYNVDISYDTGMTRR